MRHVQYVALLFSLLLCSPTLKGLTRSWFPVNVPLISPLSSALPSAYVSGEAFVRYLHLDKEPTDAGESVAVHCVLACAHEVHMYVQTQVLFSYMLIRIHINAVVPCCWVLCCLHVLWRMLYSSLVTDLVPMLHYTIACACVRVYGVCVRVRVCMHVCVCACVHPSVWLTNHSCVNLCCKKKFNISFIRQCILKVNCGEPN